MKYAVFCLVAMAFGITSLVAQNISPEMLQQAAAMGYSEAEVRAQMAAQSGNDRGATSTMTQSAPQSAQGLRRAPESALESVEATKKVKQQTFGQNFFSNKNVSFEPNINIPTPKDYVLTSGDEVVITIWGDTELLYKEMISPDGVINVPNYGPVNLSGMKVADAQKYLEQRLSKSYNSLGTSSQLMLSVGQIGSIKVNVSGEVLNPGTYTVPSLANLFHIMHLCGGLNEIGDVRNIELYRDSKLVTSLDLYDYILNGNTSANAILKDGDVVVVKPYNVRVNITGQIKRPMMYQLKADECVADLIDYVGGFNDVAYEQEVTLYRNNGVDREVVMVDAANFDSVPLIDGDSLLVNVAKNEFRNIVSIDGALWRSGDFEYGDQTRTLKALIEKAGGLRGDAFATRGIITRRNDDYTTSMISFVTADVASGATDIELQNYDEVFIPEIESLREEYMVAIEGEVNNPMVLKYHKGMKIEDAIIMAGGLKESASLAILDVTRRVNNKNSLDYSSEVAEKFEFQINEDLTLNESSRDFELEPFDMIVVRRSPQYQKQTKVYVMGEVIMPGIHTFTDNNTYLSDVISMAQGLTPEAYLKGTSLTRQAKRVNRDPNDVNSTDYYTVDNITDLALNNLLAATSSRDSLAVSISDLRVYSVGVDMQKAMADPHGPDDVILQENDIVLIPKEVRVVNIIGSVNYPNATTYTTRKLKHYVGESGGYNRMAIRRPFVIYQNGKVAATKSILFFKKRPKIEPGSIVVIPTKSNRERASIAQTISAVSSMTSLASSLSTLGVAIGQK